MTAVSVPAGARLDARTAKRLFLLVAAVVGALLYLVFAGQWNLPHDESYPFYATINELRDWVELNRDSLIVFGLIREGVDGLVSAFQALLDGLGWPGVLGVAAALGLVFSGWRLALLSAAGFAALGMLGLWESSMETLAQMLAAVVIALAIGLPAGIIAGRSKRVQAVLTPILDVMQIMPTFAYLAPMTLLFGIGIPSATVATLIYAVPPAVRITALGIRGVSPTTMEAAQSMGSTRWQSLTKIQLPLARRTIGIGVNQTIMMALSMVVITALIGAPGLGADVLRALQQVNVGAAFQAGLAVVILAIVLDRLTDHAGEWMDPRSRRTEAAAGSARRRYLVAGAVTLGSIAVARLLADPTAFPTAIEIDLRDPVNAFVDWFTSTFATVTSAIKDGFTIYLLNPLQTVLTGSPWWLVVAAVAIVGWAVSGVRASVVATACLALVILVGLWQHAMETLASVLVATVVTLALGLAVGIMSARNDKTRTALRPLLDVAQTLPAFVYLIPAIALFDPSRFTAIVAAVIYAVAPVIRLVDVGIRSVSETAIEAATANGATERQLLWKVRLPLARPSLLLAANQGIVMVLAMVVVGGLVGAGALGFDVISGFSQREDFGKGFAAGIAIVLLGIMLDRITQGAGRRPSTRLARGG
ncbi:MAG TPA: ABC transporter permease subunit [Candidatus Saccharimonadales bacterium]|nr:ABC transporter permease subunit [Candidatus Saccharimonadales bacterium]